MKNTYFNLIDQSYGLFLPNEKITWGKLDTESPEFIKPLKLDSNAKPKVITSFANVSEDLQQQIKLFYPEGF